MPLDKTGRSVGVNGSHRTRKSHSSRWRSSLVAPRREAEGSIRRRPQLSDCCWAARASSEGTALHRLANRGELDLKSASVTYSCGGKTPTWRMICRPPVFSLIWEEETCQANLVRLLPSIFFSIRLFELSFFFSSTSAAGSLIFQFWNPLLLFALASLWQNQEGTSSSESLFELNFDPSRSSPSDQKLHN